MTEPIDFHGALRPLEEACRMARADIQLVDTLLNAPGFGGPVLRKAAVFLQHLRFVFRVWCLKRGQYLLVREFSNVPLALLFPLVCPWRKRLLFIVNHNLQWAVNRWTERAAFRCLGKMQCRCVFFEQVPEARLRELGISPQFSEALLHPCGACGVSPITCGVSPIISSSKNDEIIGLTPAARNNRTPAVTPAAPAARVGVVGEYRPEKKTDETLSHLLKLSDIEVVVGVPNPERFKACSRFAGSDRIRVVDTSSTEVYFRTLAGCDVLVLSCPAEAYRFRASGLIADAAACGTAVVAPDFPTLGKQAAGIGEVFQCLEEMPSAVERAVETMRSGGYGFASYCAARSAERIASMLDEFCHG